MKLDLLLILFCVNFAAYSQERVDTIYYNAIERVVHDRSYANYYRMAIYSDDSDQNKSFYDFYMSGKLKRKGHFISIDSLNDNKSMFDGEVVSYCENGSISKTEQYLDGKLSGICRIYGEDGSCKTIEYLDGVPKYDYYILTYTNGNTLKCRISDDSQIWESPEISECLIEYRDGKTWVIYVKNGLVIAMTNTILRDRGKWHRVDLIIYNQSLSPIVFTPEHNIRAYSVDKRGVSTDLKVWSSEEYLKKVKRALTWSAVLIGLNEGFASNNAGYSTSTTTGYNSYGGFSTYTTTTYNGAAAYQARLASQQRLANVSSAMQNELNIKQMEYLKKSTINPGDTLSGFAHVERIKGTTVVFTIDIEGVEYIYKWNFSK